MRIAHLTLLHGYNYGGMLQAYATQQILRSYGHEVITLDYHPARRMQLLRRLCLNIRSLHQPIGLQLDEYQFSGVKNFHEFRQKHFTFSAPCIGKDDLEKACQGIDVVVVGSDQVWSSAWLRTPYFIDFKIPDGCKRVSLAACSGQPSDIQTYIDYTARTLAQFDAISVRNDFTAEMVQKAIGESPVILCDPTLATDLPTIPVPGINGDYILTYLINQKSNIHLTADIIKIVRKKTGLPVLSIPPSELKGKCTLGADQIIQDISPFQWGHLLKNAKHIITDSFHGVLYALKNHVDFTVISNENIMRGRIQAILNDTGLSDRIVTPVNWDKKLLPSISLKKWHLVSSLIVFRKNKYLRFTDKLFKNE